MKSMIWLSVVFFIIVASFPAGIVSADDIPSANTELFNQVNYLNLQVEEMWEAGYDGSEVNVAVLDTGLVLHPDLSDTQKDRTFYCYVWRPFLDKCVNDTEKSVDELGHGTHISGIINSSNKRIGIAPASNLYVFKVVGTSDKANQPNRHRVLNALEFIQKHNENATEKEKIHIVSMSFRMEKDVRVEKIINEMYKNQNVIFVAAVSNTGTDNPAKNIVIKDAEFITSMEAVIGVGNVNEQMARTVGDPEKGGGSFVGKSVSITAPGNNIISTFPLELDTKKHFENTCEKLTYSSIEKCIESMWDGTEDGYNKSTGTSMATAVVTGYLSLLKNQYPNNSNRELRGALLANTIPRPGKTNKTPGDLEYGSGVLQAVPYGSKYLIETSWNTYLYDIPVDDKTYYYPATLPTNTLEVYLEWTNPASTNNETWLKVKIDDDLYKWVLLNEVSKVEYVYDSK